jgi:hypothetical protein
VLHIVAAECDGKVSNPGIADQASAEQLKRIAGRGKRSVLAEAHDLPEQR